MASPKWKPLVNGGFPSQKAFDAGIVRDKTSSYSSVTADALALNKQVVRM